MSGHHNRWKLSVYGVGTYDLVICISCWVLKEHLGYTGLVDAHWYFLAVLNTGPKTSGSSLKLIPRVEINETDFPKGYSNRTLQNKRGGQS